MFCLVFFWHSPIKLYLEDVTWCQPKCALLTPWWSLARSWWEDNCFFGHIFRAWSPAGTESSCPTQHHREPSSGKEAWSCQGLPAHSRFAEPLAVLVCTLTLHQTVQGKVSSSHVRNQYQWKAFYQAMGVKMPLGKSAFTDAPLHWKFSSNMHGWFLHWCHSD